jgi:hypothetical protein
MTICWITHPLTTLRRYCPFLTIFASFKKLLRNHNSELLQHRSSEEALRELTEEYDRKVGAIEAKK